MDTEETSKERKHQRAITNKRWRLSPNGKAWRKAYEQRPEVKAYRSLASKRPKNKEAIRKWELRRDFGITLEEYDQMFKNQGGLCAICYKPDSAGKRLSVDHCHTTRKVRGLLCGNCNRALGLFKDSLDRIRKAIKYLKAN